MHIKLLEDGKFLLESMSGQKITVNKIELSQLAKLADSYKDQPQQSSARGVRKIVVTPVTDWVVSVDTHHTEVILRLRHPGFEEAYSVPLHLAKGMAMGLTDQTTFIEKQMAQRKGRPSN
jgi:hypothetical protein